MFFFIRCPLFYCSLFALPLRAVNCDAVSRVCVSHVFFSFCCFCCCCLLYILYINKQPYAGVRLNHESWTKRKKSLNIRIFVSSKVSRIYRTIFTIYNTNVYKLNESELFIHRRRHRAFVIVYMFSM